MRTSLIISRLRVAASRIRGLFTSRRLDADFQRELAAHLSMIEAENLRRGLPPDEARRQARLRLGAEAPLRETHHDLRGLPWLESVLRDVRFGLRMLRKNPGFTAVAVLTLALGVGANTAIFSVVDAVLLRPLPYPHPSRLVNLFESQPSQGVPNAGASYPDLESWREQCRAFSDLAGVQFHQLTLTGRGEPAVVDTVVVSFDFFPLLEVKPLLGRTLLPEDAQRGAPPAVVLSEILWRGRFGADPDIVGRAITLDKRPFTVVGVMPADFRTPFFTGSGEIWIPVAQDPVFRSFMTLRAARGLPVLGRLEPGVSLAQAQAEMDAVAANLAREFPATNAGFSVRVEPLQRTIVRNARTALLVLLGAVGLVLLIACANIANLLLARATARASEMSIRVVLGAGRSRIILQLLTESMMLGLAGGLAGVVFAYWGVAALVPFLPPDLPRLRAIAVDGRVLGFALLLSIVSSLVFGLAPAFVASGASLQASVSVGAGRTGEASRSRRALNLLAVAEISLAMVLLVGAGLLLHSFLSLTSVNPGFDARQVWTAEVSLPQYEYKTPRQWTAFSDQLLARIHSQAGLQDSALAAPLPMDAQGSATLSFTIVGNPPLPPGTSITADYVSASPGYFRVMGIPLLRGRTFSVEDSPSSPSVTVISQAMARRYFPHEDPIGHHLLFGLPVDGVVSREIIGVVGDVRDVALNNAPQPMMYVPFAQAPLWGGELVVKSGLNPASIVAAIRRQVRSIDPSLPVTGFESLSSAVHATSSQPRFHALLLGLFAAIALLLAALGIFGVISYSVSRRTHEIGIRMALGAQPGDVVRMVLGQGARIALVGVALGLVASLGLTRLISTMLFGVSATDPLTFAAVVVLLLAVALLACYIPARRAMRVDPMAALRHE